MEACLFCPKLLRTHLVISIQLLSVPVLWNKDWKDF